MRRTLLVLDVLEGIFRLPTPVHDEPGFVHSVQTLIERARAAGAEVIHAQHEGLPGSPFAAGAAGQQIDPRVAPLPGEAVLHKLHPDAFHGTDLALHLARRAIREIVVCGFSTEGCVDTTVRSAYARGLSVILAADGHTTTSSEVLEARQIISHHNQILTRFAAVVPHDGIVFGQLHIVE